MLTDVTKSDRQNTDLSADSHQNVNLIMLTDITGNDRQYTDLSADMNQNGLGRRKETQGGRRVS